MGQMVDDVPPGGERASVPVDFFGRTGGIIPTPAEVLARCRSKRQEVTIDGDCI